MRQTFKLPDLRNVVAGGTAILTLPVGGPTYDVVLLNLANITAAQLDNIRVKVNGKEVMFFEDAALLQDLNDFYGRPAVANQYNIFFNRPEMTELFQERLTGLGTLDVQTVTIEMDIDAAAVSPAITARALISAPSQIALINKVKRYPFNFSVSGQVECQGIVLGPRVAALHFKKSDVASVQIEDGGIPIVQDIAKADLEIFQKAYGRVPQTGFTHVDFLLDGDHAQALVTAAPGADGVVRTRALRILPTLTTSGALTVYAEYLDGLAGI